MKAFIALFLSFAISTALRVSAAEPDSDFDGISDAEETALNLNPNDGTDAPKRKLATFRFNGTNWIGDQGQVPVAHYGLTLEAGVESNAVKVTGGDWAKYLVFRLAETNDKPNLSFRQGSVSMWFKPNWNGTNHGGNGPVPAAWGRIFNIGEWTTDASYGLWTMGLTPDGDWISFTAHTNNGTLYGSGWGQVPGGMVSNEWRHVAMTYSTTNMSIYIDGTNVMDIGCLFDGTNWFCNVGNSLIPPKTLRDQGFYVGTDTGGNQASQGTFDLLETYNYPLSAVEVLAAFDAYYFSSVNPGGDYDGDGVSNGVEAALGRNPKVAGVQSGSTGLVTYTPVRSN